jgi:hypothetical protein
MKKIINMERITNSRWNLFLLVVLFATFSCNHDEMNPVVPEDNDGEIQEVILKVNVPFEESSQLRSIGPAQENAIQTIDVLAFRVSGDKAYFDYYAEGRKAAGNTEGTSSQDINVTLWTRANQQLLVVVTNARDEVNRLLQSANPVGWRGAEKDAMLAGLEYALTQEGDKWKAISATEYTAFPMWGESEADSITKQTTQLTTPIYLLRMLAKIDVQLDENVAGLTNTFKMKSVRLYNTNTKGKIVPGAVPVTVATVPTDAGKYLGPLEYTDFSSPGKTDVAVCGSIYTFETKAPAATLESVEAASNATCLVVGGIYDNSGKVTYYRIDFLDEDKKFIDILRNHQYTVNIKDVTGNGYATPEEAFEAKSVNMSVDILNWDKGGMNDVVFDGQFYLSVSRNAFNFSREELNVKRANNVLAVLTNYKTNISEGISGWYIEKIVDAEDGVTPVNWVQLVDDNGTVVTQGNPDIEKELVLYLDANPTGANEKVRSAKIIFAAGRLRYPVTVTQNLQEIASISIVNSAKEPIEKMIFSSKIGTEDAYREFSISWTPLASELVIYEAIIIGVPYEDYQVTGNFGVLKGGSRVYTIRPTNILSDVDISINPFYEKAIQIVASVSNGINTEQKSLVIRRIYYNLTTTNVANSYSLNGAANTFYVKSNANWFVKSITDTDNILLNKPAIMLQTGSGDTDTGEPFTFALVADETKEGKSAQIVMGYTDPTGTRTNLEKTVTITAKK